jgi:ABC-2 type transport system ATP-binding protein
MTSGVTRVSYAALFDGVTKTYRWGLWGNKRRVAVSNVSLIIPTGAVFGLVGPNRAGKTTLLKLLLSLCCPSSGQVERLGRPTTDKTTLARVGYMHENQAFPKYLTPVEILYFCGKLSGYSGDQLQRRIQQTLERVNLHDRRNEFISTFSKGMVQRLGLAQALLNDPELMVLDEPTEGLDLLGRQLLREVILQMRQCGKTVLIVSHTLSEIEQLCDHIAIMVEGNIIYSGAIDKLRASTIYNDNDTLENILKKIYQKGSVS